MQTPVDEPAKLTLCDKLLLLLCSRVDFFELPACKAAAAAAAAHMGCGWMHTVSPLPGLEALFQRGSGVVWLALYISTLVHLEPAWQCNGLQRREGDRVD